MIEDDKPGRHNAAKTHCPKGHEYTEKNTKMHKLGRRTCRTCIYAAQNLKAKLLRDATPISQKRPKKIV